MHITKLENDLLSVEVAHEAGGRIVSLVWRPSNQEILWRNAALPLRREEPGVAYDPNFYGGIDELLPCDLEETIDGVPCPDHGELWTLALDCEQSCEGLTLHGTLPQSGLKYSRRMDLSGNELRCDYRIVNQTGSPRHFLWKLHAALMVEPGDIVECPAEWAKPVDLEWSRCTSPEPFRWATAGSIDKSIVTAPDNTVEFLYLYDLSAGRMALRSPSRGLEFAYTFDTVVFPFVWLFQSFGGFDGHYVTILEPCTTMPLSVNEAIRSGRCTLLGPGEALETTVTITVSRINTP